MLKCLAGSLVFMDSLYFYGEVGKTFLMVRDSPVFVRVCIGEKEWSAVSAHCESVDFHLAFVGGDGAGEVFHYGAVHDDTAVIAATFHPLVELHGEAIVAA